MKLGEGGEAFFVFETSAEVPAGLQTSPLVSPASSPATRPVSTLLAPGLAELEPLDLASENSRPVTSRASSTPAVPVPNASTDGRPRSESGLCNIVIALVMID